MFFAYFFFSAMFCSSSDFNSNKRERSEIEDSCAQNNKQDIYLKNEIYEFSLDEIMNFYWKNFIFWGSN